MKRFFFLPVSVTYLLIASLIYGFFKFPIELQIPLILVNSLILFIFRHSIVPYRDTLKNEGEIYLSPVHGMVESIRLNIESLDYPSPCHEVRISTSFWDEKGLYLPTSGEVTYLKANSGKKVHRNSATEVFYGSIGELSHTDLTLTSKNQTETLLRFVDCTTGRRPTIWLKSGDRGRGAACFGYYPFGGTLLIYLPGNSDILIFEKEVLIPGQSVIAALKEKNTKV